MATCPKCGASLSYDLGAMEDFCTNMCGFVRKAPPYEPAEVKQEPRGDDSASPMEIHYREREIVAETLQAALEGRLKLPSWQDWLRHPLRSYRGWRRVRAFYRAAEATKRFTVLKMNE